MFGILLPENPGGYHLQNMYFSKARSNQIYCCPNIVSNGDE
jgi:hypothetical protein